MLDDIYNKRILELAADIPRLGRLPSPDATARAFAKLCGSSVIVDIAVENGVITNFAQDVKACALGQASSSLAARLVIGATVAELRQLRETMYGMLKENGPPPEGRWKDFEIFIPVRDFKERHASTLLIFDAIVVALDEAERKAVSVKNITAPTL